VQVTPGWSAGLGDWVSTAAWSGDGQQVAVGSLAGDAVVFDAATGEVVTKLPDHPQGVLRLAWSANGLLASGGQDGMVRIVHVARDETVAAVPFGRWVTDLAWSPSAPLLGVSSGRSLAVLDAEGAARANWEDLASTVTGIAWSVGGKVSSLGAACYGGVWWYRPDEPFSPTRHLAYKGSMLNLHVAGNGRWAAAGCQDGSVHVWKLWSGDDLQMSGYPSKVEHVAYDHTSEWMAVGNGPEITVWDYRGKGPQGRAPKVLSGHDATISALAYQLAGPLLATGDEDGRLLVWHPTRSTRAIHRIDMACGVSNLGWSPDGTALVVGGADGSVTGFSVAG